MPELRYLICCLICSCPIFCIAQEENSKKIKAVNTVHLWFGNGLTFNKFNVYNRGAAPSPIRVPKATTYKPTVAITYQRTTPYGLIFGGGLLLGNYNHDVDVTYDSFSFLDTMQGFKEYSKSYSYRRKSDYWAINAFIGYSFRLNSNKQQPLCLEAKAGVNKRWYFSGSFTENRLGLAVISNDTIFTGYQAVYISDSWGNNHRKRPWIFDGYIGIRKHLKWKYINELALGAYGGFEFVIPGFSSVGGDAETRVQSGIYLHGEFQKWEWDYYLNKEVTFGIRAGFGLSF